MADLSTERVGANVAEVRAEIVAAAERAGRDPAEVELCAAVKYVDAEDLPALAEAGLTLFGENRAQALAEKAAVMERAGIEVTWDFIGQLQSRKVKDVLPLTRLIHSVASDSALRQLERHAPPGTQVLVEVNVAREPQKHGVDPDELGAFVARCPVEVVGLMTMPPFSEDPEGSRTWFRALRELAAEHGLRHLSMGTTQDFGVAVEEGATIVRVGSRLFR